MPFQALLVQYLHSSDGDWAGLLHEYRRDLGLQSPAEQTCATALSRPGHGCLYGLLLGVMHGTKKSANFFSVKFNRPRVNLGRTIQI